MDLKTWLSQERGRAVKLACALPVRAPVISDWARGKKAVPVARCAAIERVTEGAVTRQSLRPNDWHLIWPELACTRTQQPHNAYVAV